MPKLKVFRTSTGFHDAYVAAPSQKAALAAWGAEGNLFAQGLAEQVSDDASMAEALAQPGVVIKKLRGTEAEHLAALGPLPNKAKTRAKSAAAKGRASRTLAPAKTMPKPTPKRAPRPNRNALNAAEAALAQATEVQEAAMASLEKQLKALLEAQRQLETEQRRERTRLEAQLQRERDRYEAALERWLG